MLSENTVKVGNIIITDSSRNVVNITGGVGKQKGGTGQALILLQLGVGVSCMSTDLSAEKGCVKVHLPCKNAKGAIFIVFLYVTVDLHQTGTDRGGSGEVLGGKQVEK